MIGKKLLIGAVLSCACVVLADGTDPASHNPAPASAINNQAATRSFAPVTEPLIADKSAVDQGPPPDAPPDGFETRDGGDTCASATPIDSLPFADTGTTIGKANNYDSGIVTGCPYGGSTARDAVYKFTPAADLAIDVSLCNSLYDTKVYIYQDTCVNPPLACNDDADGCGNGFMSKLVGVPLLGGHTYYIVVDGYGTASGIYQIEVTVSNYQPPHCPDGSLVSQTPELVTYAGYPSDVDTGGLFLMDNIYNVSGLLCDLHWWGIQANPTGGWHQCDEANPLFNITIYPFLPFPELNYPPDLENPLRTWTNVVARRTDSGERPGNWTLWYFEADLPGCLPLDPNQMYWIAIQGTGDESCFFYWWNSTTGLNGQSFWYQPPNLISLSFDWAMCVTPGGVAGVCCDHFTGQCAVVASVADCQAPNGFYPGLTACDQLSPPCGQATGACCFLDGTPCSVITAAACAAINGNWLGPNTVCEQCTCIVTCPPDGVSEGEPDCSDGYVDTYNDGCFAAAGNESVLQINTLPITICGTTGAYTTNNVGRVDSDWYQVVFTETTYLKTSVMAEDYVRFWLIDAGQGCGTEYILAGTDPGNPPDTQREAVPPCVKMTLSRELPPGTYWIVVTGHYGDTPCGTPYNLTVETEAVVGACCFADGSCERRSDTVCAGLGGTFTAGVQCGALMSAEALTVTVTVDPSAQAIPDWNGSTPQWKEINIDVPSGLGFIVADVDVDLKITHPDISELYIAVSKGFRQVDMARVDPATGIGTLCEGAGTPGMDVLFNDEGAAPVCSTSVLTGEIVPYMPLSLFDNGSTAGTWTLSIFDGVAGNTGTIEQFSLHFRRLACPPPPPTGACCVDTTCTPGLTLTACQAQGGVYQGDNTACDPNPCVPPTGACCVHSVCTSDLTEAVCTALGGTYQGGGSTCTPDNPCPACYGDADCSGAIDFDDISYFVAGLAGGEPGWKSYYARKHAGVLPPCTFWNCDANASGLALIPPAPEVDFDDISPFVKKLVTPPICP